MDTAQTVSLIEDILKGNKTRKDLDVVEDKALRAALQKVSFVVLEKQIAYRSLNDLRINYDKIINALSCAIVLLQSDKNFPGYSEAARHSLEIISLELPFHNAALYLVPENPGEDGLVELVGYYNREEQRVIITGDQEEPLIHGPEEGIIGWVSQHRETALLGDVERDTRFLPIDGLGMQVSSLICTPLVSRGKFMGVLSFSHHIKGFFHEHDIRILETMGEFIAYYLYHSVLVGCAEESP
ncbi:GAF domain-containing protein [Desulfurispira natronophila]|uniref:GAF domain-containing protein n=1 Tax=Desulfurispira natronophila TaxID=682562 RepID=A0A7W7Y4T9_9BACT|nr:GAF domain-containing protein [Desulfurispira natronophila]MBB5022115.1 GAF domain-containing protein [Desulfurispira natronophila]